MDDHRDHLNTRISRAAVSRKMLYIIAGILCLLLAAIVLFLYGKSSPPSWDEEVAIFRVDRGMSVKDIAEAAEEKNIVKSSLMLYAVLTYAHDPTTIYAGTYSFNKPHTVFEVAEKLAQNDIDKTLVSLTIPEGTSRKAMAELAKSKIESFDSALFLKLTKNNEGYLFPDTYYVSPDFRAEELVTLLTKTFAAKLAPYSDEMAAHEFTEYEIVTLASLLEREANDEQSMRMVSGILQNRISIGMPLQADASMEYVLDKELADLTPADLELDTPYNTYLYKGLPPTPIGNPGLLAIEAVLDPIETEYLFYITGTDGNFYYAETFDEHKINVQKYLR